MVELPLLSLPLGAIRPRGWLHNQLAIQAEGLSGHLDEFWPPLGEDSGWLGGKGESWEIGPYYLDGLLPLAYLLKDEILIQKANRWMDFILDNQHPSGWIGPISDPHEDWHGEHDVWPVMIVLKALSQFQEVTGDDRVIPAFEKFFKFLGGFLPQNPLRTWSRFRWPDLFLSLLWLYTRNGDDELLNLAKLIQSQGYDWTSHFSRFRFREKVLKGEEGYDFRTHGVNNAMGIKAPGLWYQVTGNEVDREAVLSAIENLDRFHGQATGVFTADGHLAGLSPSQGTELCTVVEYLFSLQCLVPIMNLVEVSDRLEKIAFNALPAAFAPDMWSHQYDQQANQALCTLAERNWTTNWDDSNIFGLEPSFTCCLANMHQGWPKFVKCLWMTSPDGGLTATAYAPNEVELTMPNGETIKVVEETDYPFDERVRFTVIADRPVDFTLSLRIPAWCTDANLNQDGEIRRSLPTGEYVSIDKTWMPNESITLDLPMDPRPNVRSNGAISIEYGPLVFSLYIEEEWRQLRNVPPLADRTWEARVSEEWKMVRGDPPHSDYEVMPTSPWNYGLYVDLDFPEEYFEVEKNTVGKAPFSPQGAPIHMIAKGKRISGWKLSKSSAAPPPKSPVTSDDPMEHLKLIPYGCTNLRITEFPVLQR
jgi:hypothetical protein